MDNVGLNIELVKMNRDFNIIAWDRKEINVYHEEFIGNAIDYLIHNIKEMDILTTFNAGEININLLDKNYHTKYYKRITLDNIKNGLLELVEREYKAGKDMYEETKRIELKYGNKRVLKEFVEYIEDIMKEELKEIEKENVK